MADQNWEDWGRSVQQAIDRAVSTQDFQKLNQTIRKTVSRATELGTDALRRASAPPPKPLYGSPSRKTAASVVKLTAGIVIDALSALLLLGALTLALLNITALSMLSLGLTLGALGAGIALTISGIRGLGWVSRFRAYRKALGARTHCALEDLARQVDKKIPFVRRELRQMIDAGLFLEGHLDNEEQTLITSDETYRHFEQSRLALEQRQQAQRQARQDQQQLPQQVRQALDRGQAFLDEIHRCNDRIPGHEVSAKIDRLEATVRRIFRRLRSHPESVDDLKKLMDYYLPMTVKLLNAYAEMDTHETPTVTAAKKEIEDTLDTLNLAFDKLLDSIFQDTALDVSSDISVLNTLLAQEGLTEDPFAKS